MTGASTRVARPVIAVVVVFGVLLAQATARAQVYGAWAWSASETPRTIRSGQADTLVGAKRAAEARCKAADGTACYARAWFHNAYSALAFAANGPWGVSWSDTSAGARSLAISRCRGQNGAKNCAVVRHDQTTNPASPDGGVIRATFSYGVWAISPSRRIAAFGVAGTLPAAEKTAVTNCVTAHGLGSECSVYGAWVKNGYSSIARARNGRWAFSIAGNPKRATSLALNKCRQKARKSKCTIVKRNHTRDPWLPDARHNSAWIGEPIPKPAPPSPVVPNPPPPVITGDHWAGYAAVLLGPYTSVKAQWNQPAITSLNWAPLGKWATAIWVGLGGGQGSGWPVQVGTEMQTNFWYNHGIFTPNYQAVYQDPEHTAGPNISDSYQVHAGDHMSAEVDYSHGKFHLSLGDTPKSGKSWTWSTNVTDKHYPRDSAEVIVERPQEFLGIGPAYSTLAPFTTVSFTNVELGLALPIEMKNASGQTLVSVSIPPTGPGSFTATYELGG